MTGYRARVTEELSVDADALFALLIDIDRLPDWNQHNHHVVSSLSALVEPAPGALQPACSPRCRPTAEPVGSNP